VPVVPVMPVMPSTHGVEFRIDQFTHFTHDFDPWGVHVNNIWLKASRRLTRVYRGLVFPSVTEITGGALQRLSDVKLIPDHSKTRPVGDLADQGAYAQRGLIQSLRAAGRGCAGRSACKKKPPPREQPDGGGFHFTVGNRSLLGHRLETEVV
jgi:hypothetical protein